jgi:NADH:ubiquinone oxidoreductase subunit K
MIITTAHYLVLAAVLFSLSVAGIFDSRPPRQTTVVRAGS